MIKTDDIDEKIIRILTADARTSNREVARLIDLSETAVRKRLKRLSGIGMAKITTVVNPAAIGLSVSAFVRLQTTPASARAVADQASKLEAVSFAALMAGRFNVIVLLTVADRRALADVIHEHFRCWAGVHMIDTVELTANAKHRLDLILIPSGGEVIPPQ